MASVRSWSSIVNELDPEAQVRDAQHIAYRFSNGRQFIDNSSSAGFVMTINQITGPISTIAIAHNQL